MAELPSESSVFGIFNRDLLPDRIAERLVSLIADSELRPGEKLPSERDLAAMMQVSRPSLRAIAGAGYDEDCRNPAWLGYLCGLSQA